MWRIEVKTFNEFHLESTNLEDLAKLLGHPNHQRISLYQIFDKDNKRLILEGVRFQIGHDIHMKVTFNCFL